ncbi:transporter [Arthrobacter sp. PAMC25284]|uniref:transporter n=1 Tax=Arthrobacter sp. PAMC25284 TaxID=2861279 RepID=UPI001C62B6AA|nr:transporter [Arthrobacter sp. PAMC25284]QYF89798.1 transporter [Arthrobacter sp. PAMC25284]
MVEHLLRLKITLLRNSVRRSPRQLVGLAIGALFSLALVGLGVAGLLALRMDLELARTVVVLAGATALLGWAVVPVVMTAGDLMLDPARFSTFAVPMPQLLTGLALGGLIGIPGAATSVLALATVGTWSRSAPAAAGALLGAVLGVLSCVVLSKVVTTATARLVGSRRFRDISAVVFLIPLVLTGPIVAGVADGIARSGEFLPQLARTLSWTPAGAAWSLGGELAAGSYGAAALKLLIALATLAGLALCWKTLLQRALVSPPNAGQARKKNGGLGLFVLFPATPTGAVAARSLSYWVRDPRYTGALIVVPLMPVLLFFQSSQTGTYAPLLMVGPLTAFLLAWAISSDVSYDSTAFALHVATGVRGVHDRLGRALACLAFALPAVLVFSIGPFVLLGDWDGLPGMLGLSLGVLFSGMGLSSAVSARYTVNVPLPGDSPFKEPPGNVAQTLAVQFGGMGVLVVLVSPEIALLAAQWSTGSPVPGWINLFVGPVLGLALFGAGVRLGGRWLDARGPELLAQLAVHR